MKLNRDTTVTRLQLKLSKIGLIFQGQVLHSYSESNIIITNIIFNGWNIIKRGKIVLSNISTYLKMYTVKDNRSATISSTFCLY